MGRQLSSSTPNNAVAYINGHVYTVNPSQPWAEAFIVSPDGKFSLIGSTASILEHVRQHSLITIDLRSRFVMPGIHDAHVHILYSALASTSQIRLSPELNTATAIEELKRGSCLCKFTHTNADWVPDTPVMIRGGAGHNAYLNTEALRRSGYDIDNEPDAQGCAYIRDEHGALTGEMSENSMSKACLTVPKPSQSHIKRVLKSAIAKLHRAGVTSVQEASASTSLLTALQELDSEGGLKIDVYAHTVYAPDWIAEEDAASLHATIDEAEKYASTHLHTRFVKIILDGVPLPPYFTHAGLKDDNTCDETRLLTTHLFDAVRKYDAKNMTLKIHCTGHGATRLTLDAIAAARESNPSGPRHEVAHCSGVHDNDYPRFKELNVTAEMSPAFFFCHPITLASGGLMDWSFAKMREHGAHMTIGSDWGAGEDPAILPHLEDVHQDAGGSESLVRMLTLGGAEAVGRERETGSIEVGKAANFVVLSQDLAKGEWNGCKVLATYFGGECVFEAGE